jgi:hypothetical protein
MRSLLVATVAATLLASGCNNCVRERCAYPALILTVHDAFGGDFLPEATVSQQGVPLSTEGSSYCADGSCTHAVTPPGAGPVTVSLPGYENASVDYIPRHDPCGNFIRQAVDVGMVQSALSLPPEVSPPRDLGAGCNSR